MKELCFTSLQRYAALVGMLRISLLHLSPDGLIETPSTALLQLVDQLDTLPGSVPRANTTTLPFSMLGSLTFNS